MAHHTKYALILIFSVVKIIQLCLFYGALTYSLICKLFAADYARYIIPLIIYFCFTMFPLIVFKTKKALQWELAFSAVTLFFYLTFILLGLFNHTNYIPVPPLHPKDVTFDVGGDEYEYIYLQKKYEEELNNTVCVKVIIPDEERIFSKSLLKLFIFPLEVLLLMVSILILMEKKNPCVKRYQEPSTVGTVNASDVKVAIGNENKVKTAVRRVNAGHRVNVGYVVSDTDVEAAIGRESRVNAPVVQRARSYESTVVIVHAAPVESVTLFEPPGAAQPEDIIGPTSYDDDLLPCEGEATEMRDLKVVETFPSSRQHRRIPFIIIEDVDEIEETSF